MGTSKGEVLGIPVKVLYQSSAGPKKQKATLKGETISIGAESWTCKPHHRWARGSGVKWDFVLPQGRSEALAPYGEANDISALQLDAIVNNNMVVQLNAVSQPRKTQAINWVQLSITIGLVLCVIGSSIYTSNRMDGIEKLIKTSHPEYFAPPVASTTPGQTVQTPQGNAVIKQGG